MADTEGATDAGLTESHGGVGFEFVGDFRNLHADTVNVVEIRLQ